MERRGDGGRNLPESEGSTQSNPSAITAQCLSLRRRARQRLCDRGRFLRHLQADGYAGYSRLIAPERIGLDSRLVYCWAHARRKLVEITRSGTAPIAEDGVERIAALYRTEARLRGLDPETRLAGVHKRSAPLVADMQAWLVQHRARVATKSPLGEALA